MSVATFEFEAELWEWDARRHDTWVFVTLPIDIADEIDDLGLGRRRFGSVPVVVRTGTSEWRTSIFPDTKRGSFVLPLKKAVRTKNGLVTGTVGRFEIDVSPDH